MIRVKGGRHIEVQTVVDLFHILIKVKEICRQRLFAADKDWTDNVGKFILC